MSTFFHQVATALAQARMPLVLAGLALHLAGLVITSERWWQILASLGTPVSRTRACLINLAGNFVRNVTPTTGLGGDAARVGLLRAAGVPLAQATITLGAVRIAEVPPIAILVASALPALHDSVVDTVPRNVLLLAVPIVLLLGMVIRQRAPHAWMAGLRAARAATAPRATLLLATGLAGASWFETAARLLVLSAALGVHLAWSQAAALTVFFIVGGLVPSIGAVGAVEGSLMAGLLLFGVPAAAATAITIVERAISYGVSTALGAVAVAALGGRDLLRRQSRAK